jgi:outer membrane lipoprotein-sorting protein
MKQLGILLSLLILGISFTEINAQESDPKALEILEKVANKTRNLPGFYTEFVVSVKDLADPENNQSFDGKIWYKEGKYKMEMLEQIIFSDGKTNWVYQGDIEEISITNYVKDEESMLIDPFFLLENFGRDYVCRFISDKFENNRALISVDLFPNTLDKTTYSRIKLKLDKTKHELYEFTLVGNEGVNYTVTLVSFNGKAQISDEKVSFDSKLFPEAEIIDMRD